MQPTGWKNIFANDNLQREANIYNIQKTHKLNNNEKQSNKKMGRGLELLSRRYTDSQQIYEKMLSLTSYKINANLNYNEIPPHAC